MEINFSVMAIFMPFLRMEVVSKSTLFGTTKIHVKTVPKSMGQEFLGSTIMNLYVLRP